jgi:hypothetical protein
MKYSVRLLFAIVRRMFGGSATIHAYVWDKQTGKGIALVSRKA